MKREDGACRAVCPFRNGSSPLYLRRRLSVQRKAAPVRTASPEAPWIWHRRAKREDCLHRWECAVLANKDFDQKRIFKKRPSRLNSSVHREGHF